MVAWRDDANLEAAFMLYESHRAASLEHRKACRLPLGVAHMALDSFMSK